MRSRLNSFVLAIPSCGDQNLFVMLGCRGLLCLRCQPYDALGHESLRVSYYYSRFCRVPAYISESCASRLRFRLEIVSRFFMFYELISLYLKFTSMIYSNAMKSSLKNEAKIKQKFSAKLMSHKRIL